MSKKRIYITGASGFTGQYLTATLEAANYQVYPSVGDDGEPLDLSKCLELTERLRQCSPDIIVHLAGIASPTHDKRSQIFRVNAEGTLNLMLSIEDSGCEVERILFASSAHVYGTKELDGTGQQVPDPSNDYGISKYAAEAIINQWRDKLRVIHLRLFNYTGLGQSEEFVIPKIVSHFARKATSINLGTTSSIREYNDVRWVGEIYKKLVTADFEGPIDVCSGRGYALTDILESLANMTGYEVNVITDESLFRRKEIAQIVGNPAQLQRLFPEISHIHLPETLEWMIANQKVV